MQKSFWDAVKGRRSIYGLGDEKIVSNERICRPETRNLAALTKGFGYSNKDLIRKTQTQIGILTALDWNAVEQILRAIAPQDDNMLC